MVDTKIDWVYINKILSKGTAETYMPLKFFLEKPAFKCIVKLSILIQIPIRNTVKIVHK